MADIPIPWKKIARGLPKGKKYGDDRIPTIEEIKKVVEYPDRRIRSLVCTMESSGINTVTLTLNDLLGGGYPLLTDLHDDWG
jgi:hypothetical protein